MEHRSVNEDLLQSIAHRCRGHLLGVVQPSPVLVDREPEPYFDCLVAAFEEMSRRMTADPLADLLGQ